MTPEYLRRAVYELFKFFIRNVILGMNSLQMRSEVVSARPNLLLAAALVDRAEEAVADSVTHVGMQTSLMSVEVVGRTESICPTPAAWDVTDPRLSVPGIVFTTRPA
jgi:hypothetical protein